MDSVALAWMLAKTAKEIVANKDWSEEQFTQLVQDKLLELTGDVIKYSGDVVWKGVKHGTAITVNC